MEIEGISDGVGLLTVRTLLGITATCLLLVLTTAAVRIRVRLPRPPFAGPVGRLAPVLGFALALAGGPARAEKRAFIAPPVRADGATPPWSEASGFPPPRPLARTEASDRGSAHPALHARRSANQPVPLFPRAPRSAAARERAEAMRRHPAGKAMGPSNGSDREMTAAKYVVRNGDTLWSIAQRELQTEDIRAIARFWPKIHRANRDTIPDPSLILPGQILVIPKTKEVE